MALRSQSLQLHLQLISPWQYEHEDTTHFSVADAEGNMVSVTQTVNGLFGAKIIPDGYGFVLNNEMDDFSANPESPNAINFNLCNIGIRADEHHFVFLGNVKIIGIIPILFRLQV